jgi:Holliday junction resolvase-like predicted endonuclease
MVNLSAATKGAKSELEAAVWLMEQGWLVFRNLAPDGLADLTAYHPQTKVFMLVDVKTRTKKKPHWQAPLAKLTERQIEHGVCLLTITNSQCALETTPIPQK